MEPNLDKQYKYVDFIDYYANLSEEEIIEFQNTYLNEQGEIMGLKQILRNECREEAHQEGLRLGRQQECINMITRLLRRKFGLQPELESLFLKLPLLPLETLEDMAEASLDWTELHILITWVDQQHKKLTNN